MLVFSRRRNESIYVGGVDLAALLPPSQLEAVRLAARATDALGCGLARLLAHLDTHTEVRVEHISSTEHAVKLSFAAPPCVRLDRPEIRAAKDKSLNQEPHACIH